MAKRVLHGYARGHDGSWEAICPEVNIAVQGQSCEGVRHLLEEAVSSYIEDAMNETPENAFRLMNRRVPFWLRVKLPIEFAIYRFFHHDAGAHADFDVLCHA
jgi:hypothetical protein